MDDSKCEQCQESREQPCFPVPKSCQLTHRFNKTSAAKRKLIFLETSPPSDVAEAFYSAIKHQHMKCYSMYLEKGASIDAALNATGHNALHLAVVARNKAVVMDLISRCVDWTVIDVNGANMLHIAIEYVSEDLKTRVTSSNLNSECESDNSQQEIIEMLTIFLDLGLEVDSEDFQHRTPLSIALGTNMRKVAEFLIDRGANVNHCDELGDTLLHRLVTLSKGKKDFAQLSHCAKLIIFLISKGANVNSTNNDGYSPLDLAVKYDLEDVKFILLHHVNNVNLKLNGATSKTTLHIYMELICQKKIQKLAEKYDFKENFDMYSVVERMIERGASVDVADDMGNSPLHVAMNFEDEKLILLLLRYSTNVNACNSNGDTLLHVFFKKYRKNSNISLNKEIFEIFKEKADFKAVTRDGENMIHLVSEIPEVNIEVIDYLLMQGFDVTAPRNDTLTPIHLAARSGNLQMINILLDQGVDVNCQEKRQRRTPIHMAAEQSNRYSVGIIEFLVKNGADINARDADGETALLKINYQKINYITLLKLGADIHAEDKKGRNILHKAMESNEELMAKFLYDFGVNINLKNCSIDERDDRVKQWFEHIWVGKLSYQHIVKLELANLPVPEIYHPFMGPSGPERICDDNFDQENDLLATLKATRSKCQRECPSEIQLMKIFLLNDTMSIYDFLHMTFNRQVHEVDNEILANLVSQSNIEIMFPSYCGIIRMIYNEASRVKKRKLLKEFAAPVLCQLSNCSIPDLCMELIFNYLSNQDLNHIIMSLN